MFDMNSPKIPLAAVDCVVVVIVFQWLRFLRSRRDMNAPPGPKGYPIIGNVFDMMVPEIWVVAQEWGRKYGAIQLCFWDIYST